MLPLDNPPAKICIIRLSALGDVTHAVPVLRAIQRQWPQTRVTWITSSLEHKLLSLLDGVTFVVIDKNAGWRGYWKLWRQLADEKFDVMLQMQTSARANATGACVKAEIKLGWDRYRARDFHRLFMTHTVPPTRFEHQLLGHLSFARTIGLEVDQPEWNFPVTADAAAFVEQTLAGRERVLVISPCSSHSARNWHAEGYAAVADYAANKHGMTVVLSGGPSALEAAMGETIEQAMQNRPINLIGKDTLPQLVALLQRADIVLSPDSGPAHLANAMGTIVIGLHASTWSKRSGPYSSLDLCVDKFAEAAQIFRQKKPEDLRWGTRIEEDGVMDLIEVDEVIEKLERAIERLGWSSTRNRGLA
ncbi:MAG: glycosyltransferase family 9 protein [Gammaproteobacteria bacterium]|nr:MAG: glycosyltransferase family 9 protein [Gammaproteobacteria bacterium]UCH39879.1 MAG: glycosyltransferase family 9 protein [Gammaproteobacteria bacterium]